MVKLWLGVLLVTIGASYVKGSCEYTGFLTCLNDTILNEWSELEKDGKTKLDSDRSKSIKCLRSVSCSGSCEPKEQFDDEIDDPEIKSLVVKLKNIWDKWPRAMQACVLEDVRNKFFKELETRVQETRSDFKLPSNLGPLPMPPRSLYEKNGRYELKRYIGDRIGAVLCLQPCGYDDKKTAVKCMKKEIDAPLGKCVSSKLCSLDDCKNSFKPTCAAVSKATQQIITDTGTKLSIFDEENKTNMLRDLAKCKTRAAEEEGVAESTFYRAADMLSVYTDFIHIGASKKTEKFKSLIKDLFNSYFDGDAFCTTQDC